MKGSVISNYANFKINCAYTYFEVLWLYFEPRLKISNQNKKLIQKIITYKFSKSEIKDLFDIDQTFMEMKIEKDNKVVNNSKIIPLISLIVSLSSTLNSNTNIDKLLETFMKKLKVLMANEVGKTFRKIELKLKKLMKNEKLITNKICQKNNCPYFEVNYSIIYGINLSVSNMLDTELKWDIKEVDKENPDIIKRILAKYGINDDLTIITLEEVEVYLLKSIIERKYLQTIFVDLPDQFFKNKTNIKRLTTVLNNKCIKSKVNFKINVSVLESYNNLILLLKEQGIKFSLMNKVLENYKNLNQVVHYVFVTYENVKNIQNSKDFCKKSNIEIIITGVNDGDKVMFCQKNVGDFFKKT